MNSFSRTNQMLIWMGFLVLFVSAGCVLKPEKENYIKLTLSDTWSAYDEVEIQAFQRDTTLQNWSDTNKLLGVVLKAKVIDAANLAPIPIDQFGLEGNRIVLRIRGFLFEGQVAKEIFIRKNDAGKQFVDQIPIIDIPTPYLDFLQYIDIRGPHIRFIFDQTRTQYTVLAPMNVDSLRLLAKLLDSRAQLFFNNDSVSTSEILRDIRFKVNDSTVVVLKVKNHGHEKSYRLVFRNDPSAGPAHLTSMKTTPGYAWTPPITPNVYSYVLNVMGTDSVLSIDTLQSDFPSASFLFNEDYIDTFPFTVRVPRSDTSFTIKVSVNGGTNDYNFTVNRP